MSAAFRTRSIEDSIRDTDEPEHRLEKNLSGLDPTVFGVGVIIGTGIVVRSPGRSRPAGCPSSRRSSP